MTINKYDIVVVDLESTVGSEQKGVRPCLIMQNNKANAGSQTTVVAIFTTRMKRYPHMLKVHPSKENGLREESLLNMLQIRTIDKTRIKKKIGFLEDTYKRAFRQTLLVSFDVEDLF